MPCQPEPAAAESSHPQLETSSYLASFPQDILGEIFLECIPVLGNKENLEAYFPWSLTHVCSHWRVSALAFPKLWSFLDVRVNQVREIDDDRYPTILLVEAYLARSGQHPLTFRLSYDLFYLGINYQPVLESLLQHSARWWNVFIENPNHRMSHSMAQSKPSDFPSLRSLVFSDCELQSDEMTLAPFPWSQLSRYHEHEVCWWPDSRRQWDIVAQLSNVVDLRAAFDETSRNPTPIKMPHLRFASLAVAQADEILSCFDFPGIQGLDLMLTRHQPHALRSVPTQLKGLRIFRLCGALGVAISKTILLSLLTELTNLVDLAVALLGRDGSEAIYLFTLLTPGSSKSILVPQLQALRVTISEPSAETINTVLVLLRQRFSGQEGVEMEPLKLFELFIGLPLAFGKRPKSDTSTRRELQWLRDHEGWNIRVVEAWAGDFWGETMDTEIV